MKQAVCLLLVASGPVFANEPTARFLLTFDDGPDTRQSDNPTSQILDVLAFNSVQDGIKAVFFTQTRLHEDQQGQITKQLLLREFDEGHLLAIHSGVSSHHSDHRTLDNAELGKFLNDSRDVLQQITDTQPGLVRPPFWAFSTRTLAAYKQHNLNMLLTDVSVSDGKSWGYRANPRRRSVLQKQMQAVRKRMDVREIPEVEGILPVVVTFHDTNTWTAGHMQEYLELLVTTAAEAGIVLDSQPFYAQREQLEQAAIQRSLQEKNPVVMVPWRWRWYVQWF